jgi:hypothetical protein
MSKTDEKNRALRRDQIARDIRALAKVADSPASKIAQSKIVSVAESLARTMAPDSDLGSELANLVEQYPSVTLPATDSPEDRAEQQAAKIAAGPTLDEIKAIRDPAARLEAANEMERRKREEAARENAKLDSEHTPDQLRGMSATARLSLANEWRKLGAEPEPKTPSAEQLRKMDAARRLDAVNAQIESSRKSASALAKRLKAARDNAE